MHITQKIRKLMILSEYDKVEEMNKDKYDISQLNFEVK
jgi:hypothetical protein